MPRLWHQWTETGANASQALDLKLAAFEQPESHLQLITQVALATQSDQQQCR